MLYILHGALALTAFLVVLNGFLRGAKKAHIDVLLSFILVGLLLTGHVAFGWKAAGLALLLAFLYAAASRPLAARVAARLFARGGGPSCRRAPPLAAALALISRELGRQPNLDLTVKELPSLNERRQRAEDAL